MYRNYSTTSVLAHNFKDIFLYMNLPNGLSIIRLKNLIVCLIFSKYSPLFGRLLKRKYPVT